MMKMDELPVNNGENDGEESNHDRPSRRKPSAANKREGFVVGGELRQAGVPTNSAALLLLRRHNIQFAEVFPVEGKRGREALSCDKG